MESIHDETLLDTRVRTKPTLHINFILITTLHMKKTDTHQHKKSKCPINKGYND